MEREALKRLEAMKLDASKAMGGGHIYKLAAALDRRQISGRIEMLT
jgi:hypothetical protein